jgi:hypothetical protein
MPGAATHHLVKLIKLKYLGASETFRNEVAALSILTERRTHMNTTWMKAGLVLLISLSLVATGCGTSSAVQGSAIGAAAGGVIGGLVGNAAEYCGGAIIGAAIGGTAGALIGNYGPAGGESRRISKARRWSVSGKDQITVDSESCSP